MILEESITVKKFIEHLQTLEPDMDIYISVRKGWRPISDVKPIGKIEAVFSIDNPPKKPIYAIDVDVEPMHRIPEKDM